MAAGGKNKAEGSMNGMVPLRRKVRKREYVFANIAANLKEHTGSLLKLTYRDHGWQGNRWARMG